MEPDEETYIYPYLYMLAMFVYDAKEETRLFFRRREREVRMLVSGLCF